MLKKRISGLEQAKRRQETAALIFAGIPMNIWDLISYHYLHFF